MNNTALQLSNPLSKYFSVRLCAAISVLFGLLAIHPYVISGVLIILCGYAILGPKQFIQALSLSVVIKYLNPAIYAFPFYSGILFWLVIFCSCIRCISIISKKSLKIILPLIYFYILVMALSVVSANPLISILKISAFTFTVAAVLIGYFELDENNLSEITMFFVSLAGSVFLLSIPTFFLPTIGFYRNGKGFQGILNHPQAFGTFYAPFAAWLASIFLFKKDKFNIQIKYFFVLLMVLIFIILTKTRTAALTIAVSLSITLFLFIFTKNRDKSLANLKRPIVMVSILLVLFTTIATTNIDFICDFVFKGGEKTSIVNSFYHSRGKAIELQWSNFLKHPLTGNGFGVYTSGSFPSDIKTFVGIPISAPVEKGIMPTALLEEIGIIGAICFLLFFFSLVKYIVKHAELQWTAMFLGCFFVNTGEAVFFSVGGIGLFFWLLMGLCLGWAKESDDTT